MSVARMGATLVVAGAIASICPGQAQVNSGRALDANLQVGTFGFNSRVSNVPLAARNYAPFMGSVNAQFRARNAATTHRLGLPGETFNIFLNDRMYTPVRTTSADARFIPAPGVRPPDPEDWTQTPGPPGATIPSSWRHGVAYRQVAPGAYWLDLRVGIDG